MIKKTLIEPTMIYFKLTISILIIDCLLFTKLCNGVSYVTDDSQVVAFYNKCKLKKVHMYLKNWK